MKVMIHCIKSGGENNEALECHTEGGGKKLGSIEAELFYVEVGREYGGKISRPQDITLRTMMMVLL